MLSALIVLVLTVDAPTPPVPPKHPEEPVVASPDAKKEPGLGHAKDAAAKEAAAKAAADKASAGKAAPDKAASEKAASEKVATDKVVGKGSPDKAGEQPEEKRTALKAPPSAADAGVDARADPAPPPSISSAALCEELRRSAAAKKVAFSKLDEERKALAVERAKLKETALEIEKAREQLRVETERLEALIEESRGLKPSGSGTARAVNPAVASGNVVNLAKTMKAMKPAQAAQLVAKMDSRLAAQVLQQMSPKDSGAVLANVKADVAAELMASLAALPPVPSKEKKR